IWGDVVFETRGCPPGSGATDDSDNRAGRMGTQGAAAPTTYVSMPEAPEYPDIFMEMPIPSAAAAPEYRDGDASRTVRLPPRRDATGTQAAQAGSPLTFTARAVDPDKNPSTYSLQDPIPAGAAIDPTTGVFTWTPSAAGVYTVKVRAAKTAFPNLF